MPAGRPTKYKPEYADELIKFFEAEDAKGEFPTLENFACHLGVYSGTLRNWANEEDEAGNLKHPEFFTAYKRAKDYQHKALVSGGLQGRFHGSFAIFTAKNVLGWRDQTDHNVNATLNVVLSGKDAQV